MTIHPNAPYCKGHSRPRALMIELANAIQAERRRQACRYRMAANLPKERTLSLGRYRVTVARDSNRGAGTA